MSAIITLLADARKPPSGIDWGLFGEFCMRVVIEPGDAVHDDFRRALLNIETELRAGNPTAIRYKRLLEAEWRRPLRARLPDDEFNTPHLDQTVVVAALLHHWTGRHAPRPEENANDRLQ